MEFQHHELPKPAGLLSPFPRQHSPTVDLPRAFCSHSHGFCTQNRQEAGMWDACWKRDRSSICFVVNDRHSQAPSLISELLDAEGPGLLHRVSASRLPHGGRNKVLRGSLRVTSLPSHCSTKGTVRSPQSPHQEFCWGKAQFMPSPRF